MTSTDAENPDDLRNQCYCHGDRHDPPRTPLDDHTACGAWVNYAYVIAPDRLQVLTDVEGGWHDHPGSGISGQRSWFHWGSWWS